MRRAALVFLLAGVVASGTALTAEQGQAPAKGFESTWWRLMSLEGLDQATLDAAPRARIRFVGGRIDGFGGCDQTRGSYTLEGDRITLGPLTVTVKGCPEAAMKLQEALKGSFAGSPSYTVADGRLTLSSQRGPTMVFEAEPAEPLEGGEWEVTGLTDHRGGIALPVAGPQVTLSFRDDASVVGNAGCNLYKAAYTRDSDRLTVGPAVATRKACPGAGVMEQEGAFLGLLEKIKSWTLHGHALELRLAGGEPAVTATRRAQ